MYSRIKVSIAIIKPKTAKIVLIGKTIFIFAKYVLAVKIEACILLSSETSASTFSGVKSNDIIP